MFDYLVEQVCSFVNTVFTDIDVLRLNTQRLALAVSAEIHHHTFPSHLLQWCYLVRWHPEHLKHACVNVS